MHRLKTLTRRYDDKVLALYDYAINNVYEDIAQHMLRQCPQANAIYVWHEMSMGDVIVYASTGKISSRSVRYTRDSWRVWVPRKIPCIERLLTLT